MSKTPPYKARDVQTVLRKLNYSVKRQKGSHEHWWIKGAKWKKGTKLVTVPIHPGEDIGRETFSNILRQMGINKKKFMEVLKS